jgi:hypothetical protein
MSTPDSTSSLPPSKPRVLTPDEADRIADSIRPSWEAPPPSARLAAQAATSGDVAGPLASTVPGVARVDADRTLTNNELRALERSKRLRAVPENSYREERSPSAPPSRVEKAASEPSIIVDPRALAAPRMPSGLRATAALSGPSAAPALSADSTVVIAPPSAAALRPRRTGVLVGSGAAAALVAGAIYFVTAQPGTPAAPAPEAPPAQQLKAAPATTPAVPAGPSAGPPAVSPEAERQAESERKEPSATSPVEPTVTSPQPGAERPAKAGLPDHEAAKSADSPKKRHNWGPAPRPDPAVAQAPPPKPTPKPLPAVGGDKGKLVRDLPF